MFASVTLLCSLLSLRATRPPGAKHQTGPKVLSLSLVISLIWHRNHPHQWRLYLCSEVEHVLLGLAVKELPDEEAAD